MCFMSVLFLALEQATNTYSQRMKHKVIIQFPIVFFPEHGGKHAEVFFLLRDQVKETCVFENIDVTS